MIALAVFIGILIGIAVTVAAISLCQAAAEADRAMQEHVRLNYTVSKGGGQ